MAIQLEGFILSRHWTDRAAGVQLEIWLSTPDGVVRAVVDGERSVFFIAQSDLDNAASVLTPIADWESKPLALHREATSRELGDQSTAYDMHVPHLPKLTTIRMAMPDNMT